MTVDEIIEYVDNTPENSNPNVLKSMLRGLNSGGSGEGATEIFFVEDFSESLTKTAGTIWSALQNEKMVVLRVFNLEESFVFYSLAAATYVTGTGTYYFAFSDIMNNQIKAYTATSVDDYPAYVTSANTDKTGIMYVEVDQNDKLTTTAGDMMTAINDGKFIIRKVTDPIYGDFYWSLSSSFHDDSGYQFGFTGWDFSQGNYITDFYWAASASSYPELQGVES